MSGAARASYWDITHYMGGGYMDRLLPFIGNSMSAGWNLIGERGSYRFTRPFLPRHLPELTREAVEAERRAGYRLIYVVWSYAEDVATYDPETDESWVSPNYWGRTTSKHLGYCRRSLPRVRSNDPSAIDGIGPGCKVRDSERPGPAVGKRTGRVIETHPLAGAVRVEFEGWPTPQVLPREAVTLA